MENGDAIIKGVSRYQGEPAEIFGALAYQLSEKEQKDFLNTHLGGKGLNLQTFHIAVGQNRDIPTAEVSFEGLVARFSQNTAKRIMIPLSWNKFPIDELNNDSWEYEETLEINTEQPLIFEGEQPSWTMETPHYKLSLETVQDANKVIINKKISTYLPTDDSGLATEDILSIMQKEFQKQLIFKK
jgi:hypothetical protein